MLAKFFYDGDYTVAIPVSPTRFLQPFSGMGDEAIYLIEQDFQQFDAHYVPLALNTPHPDFPGFYCVSDGTNLQFIGNNVRQWTRVYAKIPADRTDNESYSWTVPGLDKGGTNPIYELASVGDPTDGTIEFTTREAHDYIVGDKVFFYYQAPQSIYKPASFTSATIVEVATTTTFKINVNAAPADGAFSLIFSVQKAAPGRPPVTSTVDSTIAYDYWLVAPELTPDPDHHIVAAAKAIPIIEVPVVMDSNLQILSPPIYSGLTTPDNASYIAQIDAKDEVVAQDSTKKRWQGNIYERVTRYVIAQ